MADGKANGSIIGWTAAIIVVVKLGWNVGAAVGVSGGGGGGGDGFRLVGWLACCGMHSGTRQE
ncbi:unnamed protein product, partial [Enterobius vermicularis]|uniref:Uncharacterized protein n=1 Tax=Enterobius vermicularis TaxID=51028 RepID=A0A0N4VRH0_ENTVE